MKKRMVLDEGQKALVANNTKLVEWVIYDNIRVNEKICGLGLEDVIQEGYLCLCDAAATYDETKSSFKTYAHVVVRNGLYNYCKRINSQQKRIIPLFDAPIDPHDEDGDTRESILADEDDYEDLISQMDVMALLESAQNRYEGITRMGIEALILKTKGYTGADIANLWGVKQNNLGSWISRAKTKLLKDEQFMSGLRYDIGA